MVLNRRKMDAHEVLREEALTGEGGGVDTRLLQGVERGQEFAHRVVAEEGREQAAHRGQLGHLLRDVS